MIDPRRVFVFSLQALRRGLRGLRGFASRVYYVGLREKHSLAFSYHYTPSQPSQPSQEENKRLEKLEKRGARVVPRPALNPRNPRTAVSAADMAAARAANRTPISMVELMVWAYRREMVRFTGGLAAFDDGEEREISGTGWAMSVLLAGARAKGAAARSVLPASCHEDALAVHHAVIRHCEREESDEARIAAFWLLVNTAEAKRSGEKTGTRDMDDIIVPDFRPYLEPAILMPRRKGGTGSVVMIYDLRQKRAIACELVQIGLSEPQRESFYGEMRGRYRRWHASLQAVSTALIEGGASLLSRWRVEGIGAPAEPWLSG